jgi:hypothetical protein
MGRRASVAGISASEMPGLVARPTVTYGAEIGSFLVANRRIAVILSP